MVSAAGDPVRGGSWNNNPINCRSANRNHNQRDNINNNLGFRVCLVGAALFPIRVERWELLKGILKSPALFL
ncbi:hypothetical protein K4A83_12800 [Spirulina subsalsa FACHB-351]|uniref:Sulfatase-modifying factor enzyme domain-containing protein n=1 Tax=Spirulina subsalsa FACHB-351 TaxID=234711 RepID=A0ABT3L6K2_9CYAN|nr:hypothetical protein [Spirulina subsalsa]MCW6037141.1 hypothetical protein [Spirulina subsalsa FACHB-351]